MKPFGFTLFLLVMVCLSFKVHDSHAQASDCPKLKIESHITGSSSSDNATVTVKVEGGRAPYYYVFYHESGHPVTTETKSNTLQGVKQGIIFCSVVDANGCTEKIKISIK